MSWKVFDNTGITRERGWVWLDNGHQPFSRNATCPAKQPVEVMGPFYRISSNICVALGEVMGFIDYTREKPLYHIPSEVAHRSTICGGGD